MAVRARGGVLYRFTGGEAAAGPSAPGAMGRLLSLPTGGTASRR
jgi:hypothetical protein